MKEAHRLTLNLFTYSKGNWLRREKPFRRCFPAAGTSPALIRQGRFPAGKSTGKVISGEGESVLKFKKWRQSFQRNRIRSAIILRLLIRNVTFVRSSSVGGIVFRQLGRRVFAEVNGLSCKLEKKRNSPSYLRVFTSDPKLISTCARRQVSISSESESSLCPEKIKVFSINEISFLPSSGALEEKPH